MNHAPCAQSIAQPIDQQSSALPLYYGCPLTFVWQLYNNNFCIHICTGQSINCIGWYFFLIQRNYNYRYQNLLQAWKIGKCALGWPWQGRRRQRRRINGCHIKFCTPIFWKCYQSIMSFYNTYISSLKNICQEYTGGIRRNGVLVHKSVFKVLLRQGEF